MSNSKRFFTLLCDAGCEPFPYSGRGMFGSRCVAVRSDSGKPLDFLVSLYESRIFNEDTVINGMNNLDLVMDFIKYVRWDSLGFDTVYYFPTCKWADDFESLDDDSDDCED